MHLAIVGSATLTPTQHYSAEWLVETVVLRYKIETLGDLTIVSGGAEGVDTIAEKASITHLDKNALVFLPKKYQWQPDGYKERNIQIAEKCDELLCIRSINSTTYGSGWTADRAEDQGKVVRRYFV